MENIIPVLCSMAALIGFSVFLNRRSVRKVYRECHYKTAGDCSDWLHTYIQIFNDYGYDTSAEISKELVHIVMIKREIFNFKGGQKNLKKLHQQWNKCDENCRRFVNTLPDAEKTKLLGNLEYFSERINQKFKSLEIYLK